ncbi:NhaP-type Na/H and K/H antiporter [Anopheles sinensis]|uniref:NhaP-type Na/H and K/H antiporter n=1 Tax=Anopheles sinensis TaxID=74873 RepID=A0A084VJK3_ANOSI|nr:NhaP-type Na/H and K/H antiporter [Anopheles sinensis]
MAGFVPTLFRDYFSTTGRDRVSSQQLQHRLDDVGTTANTSGTMALLPDCLVAIISHLNSCQALINDLTFILRVSFVRAPEPAGCHFRREVLPVTHGGRMTSTR